MLSAKRISNKLFYCFDSSEFFPEQNPQVGSGRTETSKHLQAGSPPCQTGHVLNLWLFQLPDTASRLILSQNNAELMVWTRASSSVSVTSESVLTRCTSGSVLTGTQT